MEIGRRLARLARNHQVLVVTHLPQVAAFADRHLVVAKDTGGAVTTSGVRVVEETERARELARMLAGLPDSDLGIAHAEELLAVADREKRADWPRPSNRDVMPDQWADRACRGRMTRDSACQDGRRCVFPPCAGPGPPNRALSPAPPGSTAGPSVWSGGCGRATSP